MEKRKYAEIRKNALLAFGLSFCTGAAFILAMTAFRGVFYIGSDFVHQQVPFWSYTNRAIKSGAIWWSDKLDLGTQFIGGFSFYTVGSPFFWISLLLDGKYFYLFSGLWLALKFGMAGLFSYLWMQRYTRTSYAAILASLAYAFSGFQISNMNFNHFADVVALFPLLLYALDAAVYEDKKLLFAVSVFLAAITSWFSFIGQVVFLCLYFAVKLWCGEYKIKTRLFFRLAAESLLGLGASAVLLLPSILFNINNPRTSQPFTGLWEMLLLKPIHLADLVRGMLFPAEAGFYRAFFMQVFFNSGELYLPLFGLVAAAAYLFSKRKSFEARLLAICLLFALIPVLNSAFVAFNSEYYTRWFTMPVLILCLATAKTIENQEILLKKGIWFYLSLWGGFLAIGFWFVFYFKVTFIYNLVVAGVFTAISLGGFAVVVLLRRLQKMNWWRPVLLLLVMGTACITGLYNVYLMQKTWPDYAPKDLFTASDQLTVPQNEQYFRMDTEEYYFYNLSLMVEYPSITAFSSTVSGSIFDFYELCGLPRSVISSIPPEQYGYRSLLSARYWARYQAGDSPVSMEMEWWRPVEGGSGRFHLYENEYALPLGFAYSRYITPEEFKALPPESKHLVLNEVLVLQSETAGRLGDLIEHAPAESLQGFSHERFAQAVEQRRAESGKASRSTNRGYEIEMQLPENRLVFFSIPWDSGWAASVNGEKAEIYRADAGFMAVVCPAGESLVEFHYTPPGLRLGCVVSITSLLSLAGWAILDKRRNRITSRKYSV